MAFWFRIRGVLRGMQSQVEECFQLGSSKVEISGDCEVLSDHKRHIRPYHPSQDIDACNARCV
jgi:hypothetical protein